MHVSFCIMVFSWCVPSSGIAGSYGNHIFSFLGTSIVFSVLAISIYIPTYSAKGFLFFSIPSLAFIICRFFDGNYSDLCEVIFHCSFDLHFSGN